MGSQMCHLLLHFVSLKELGRGGMKKERKRKDEEKIRQISRLIVVKRVAVPTTFQAL